MLLLLLLLLWTAAAGTAGIVVVPWQGLLIQVLIGLGGDVSQELLDQVEQWNCRWRGTPASSAPRCSATSGAAQAANGHLQIRSVLTFFFLHLYCPNKRDSLLKN